MLQHRNRKSSQIRKGELKNMNEEIKNLLNSVSKYLDSLTALNITHGEIPGNYYMATTKEEAEKFAESRINPDPVIDENDTGPGPKPELTIDELKAELDKRGIERKLRMRETTLRKMYEDVIKKEEYGTVNPEPEEQNDASSIDPFNSVPETPTKPKNEYSIEDARVALQNYAKRLAQETGDPKRGQDAALSILKNIGNADNLMDADKTSYTALVEACK